MADKSQIQWTDATWNPVRGCDPVSPGCANCYAATMAARFSGAGYWGEGLAVMSAGKGRWTGKVTTHPDMLGLPLTWLQPRRIFVNSTSDLFHEGVPVDFVAAVIGVMSLACHHTYQVLTKRPERMRTIISNLTLEHCHDALLRINPIGLTRAQSKAVMAALPATSPFRDGNYEDFWPMPNLWLGVSVEDQIRASRVDILRDTPAALRFISYEPALEMVDFEGKLDGIDWVIVGGESGNLARPFNLDWAHKTVHACCRAGVACFVKQMGAKPCSPLGKIQLKNGHGADMAEWPEAIRIRQFPEVPR